MAGPGDTPVLSILMPTLARREGRFLALLDALLPQCEGQPVEVVGLQNSGEKTLAEYRQALLDDARGKWLCFVDDDDAVPEYYIEEIMAALEHDPDVVTFVQWGTGTAANLTLFGLQFLGAPWDPVMVSDGRTEPFPAYVRAYSHVQPIRSEIAKRGTYLAERMPGHTMEDQVFTASVVPLLVERGSKEWWINKVMYSYLWKSTGESTQDGPQEGHVCVQGQCNEHAAPHARPVINHPCFRWWNEDPYGIWMTTT